MAANIDTDSKEMEAYREKFMYAAIILQVAFILIFAFMSKYGDSALADANKTIESTVVQSEVDHLYPFYQDVHVMIFVGFGFLMTFLKRYTFSSVGFNFLLAALAIQWAMICNGVAHNVFEGHSDHRIPLTIENLITSDFAAGAVLITFGAVLGKVTPLQMLVVLIFELIIFAVNETIGAYQLGAVDMGGSIFVHTFGAFFGLGLSRVLSQPQKNANGEVETHERNGSSYNSDTFAMVGTLFLWMFWPSFNGALATESQQHRVVINTVLALSASCVMAFAADACMRHGRKFDMVSIQNATLAGGVAVGSSSDLVIEPWGALLVGSVAGWVSVFGYVHIQPWLAKNWNIDDTCGVNNLHGIPGLIGAVGGAISAATAGKNAYGEAIDAVFARRDPDGDNLTAVEQGGYQMAALVITLLFAIVGGSVTGLVVKHPFFLLKATPDEKLPEIMEIGKSLNTDLWYRDDLWWEVPDDFHTNKEKADTVDKEVEMPLISASA